MLIAKHLSANNYTRHIFISTTHPYANKRTSTHIKPRHHFTKHSSPTLLEPQSAVQAPLAQVGSWPNSVRRVVQAFLLRAERLWSAPCGKAGAKKSKGVDRIGSHFLGPRRKIAWVRTIVPAASGTPADGRRHSQGGEPRFTIKV